MQESPDASLVRIRTTNGGVVGAGFLVGERQILTCAHVVKKALELADYPLDAPQGLVALDFPHIPPRTSYRARVVLWRPPLADGRGDIAGLELQGEPPAGAEAVRFAPAEDLWKHPFHAFGFPSGYDGGVYATGHLLGREATDWVMIEDVKAQGFAVGPGFSGTPVWDEDLQGVVGMVVAASRPTETQAETRAAFVIPLDMLVAAWPLIEPITRQRVFLSAAPADAAFADRLRSDLEARDIVVWNEQHTPGEKQVDQKERVRQAIRAAQAVVLVVSSQTRSSRTVREQLNLADLYQRRLILVWVGDDEHLPATPPGWRETVWVDAHATHYAAALDTIEATLGQHRPISALLGPSGAGAEEAPHEPRNPYKGLRAFTANDAGDFFGRERLVDELVKDIAGIVAPEQTGGNAARLLAVIGPSGSGKSSVVMAGLLPRLQQGALSGSETWVLLSPMVPGKDPIEALGLTLAPHFPNRSFTSIREDLKDEATRGLHVLAMQLVKQRGSKVVLLVDQFEELFTQTESEDAQRRFIDLLLTAVSEPRGALIVLLTLRADFSDRPIHYPELGHLIDRHHQLVFPMELDELRATIERPVALPDVQLTFEGNLVSDLLFEMQGQVGALPLLQFTLEQLFQRRSDHRLTLSAYHEIGGVKGALSQHAEKTYAALPSKEHQELVQALFWRLIDLGTTEQDVTRRRAVFSEFLLPDATRTSLLRETADAFIDARLLTISEVAGTMTIELSHEAVIREWKLLADWIREARENIHQLQVIRRDTAEWIHQGQSVERLYLGKQQLNDALVWRERAMLNLNEEAFLQASAAEQARQEALLAERQRQEAWRRKRYTRRTVLVGLAGLGLTVSAAAAISFLFLRNELPSQPLPPLSLLYSYRGHTDWVYSVAWSPNGKRLASASRDTTVRVWDAESKQTALIYRGHTDAVYSVAWSPDGKQVASGGNDNMVQLWDAVTGKSRLTYYGHNSFVNSVAWSPDGKLIASGGNDNTVQVWDPTTGNLLLTYRGHGALVRDLAWSPDGKRIASASNDGSVQIWDATTGTRLVVYPEHADAVYSVAWSPDGKFIASAGNDNLVQVWDATTGTTLFNYTRHTDAVYSVAWSPDGKLIASAGNDNLVQVWDAKTGNPFLIYREHTNAVNDIAWSPDGKRIASASNDKTVQVSGAGITLIIYSGHENFVSAVAWSPDDKRIASTSNDGTVQVWDATTGNRSLTYMGGAMAWSPDGKHLAVAVGRVVQVWDTTTGNRGLTYQSTYEVVAVAWSPDGKRIASESHDTTVQVWDAVSGKIIFTYHGHSTRGHGLAWSPDSKRIVSVSDNKTVQVLDAATGNTLFTYSGHTDLVYGVAWSPDGSRIASVGADWTVRVWDATNGSNAYIYRGHSNYTLAVAWSPDSTRIASGGFDSTVRVWDARIGDTLGNTLYIYRGHAKYVWAVSWSPDGKRIASAGAYDQTVRVWQAV